MSLQTVLERVRARLAGSGYPNEAAVSQGIVLPILAELGWDTSDTDEVAPEFANERGRVDYALCKPGRRPVVFIEVKGVGRSLDGDKQLFEYAFHTGVPLCLLTDGREWAFYLPGGQGAYEERRVYRLQMDERELEEAASRLERYLSRARVQDGRAYEDAQRDYRDISAKRDAVRMLPRAWADLINKGEGLLIELLSDEAEQLCGVKPAAADVLAFLRGLGGPTRPDTSGPPGRRPRASVPEQPPPEAKSSAAPGAPELADGKIMYEWFGEKLSAVTAVAATVDLLRKLANHHPDRMADLAARVRSRRRAPIARSPNEINPARPDLAKAADIGDGWLFGTHCSNREKTKTIQAACDVMGVVYGKELIVQLPNG